MRVVIGLIALVVLFNVACSSEPDVRHSDSPKTNEDIKAELQHDIDSLREIHNEKGAKDPSAVNKLINAYAQYRTKFKEDEKTPMYLRSAGDLAMSLGNMNLAADLYKNFVNTYKTHSYRDDALFMLGYIYDLELNEKEFAKQTYELYFKLYGDSIHIDQVKARLTDLNLTEEELIEKFRKQNNIE
ncbi:MAG: tol-pal system YbgF family protein [Flavobacteriales bacterium]